MRRIVPCVIAVIVIVAVVGVCCFQDAQSQPPRTQPPPDLQPPSGMPPFDMPLPPGMPSGGLADGFRVPSPPLLDALDSNHDGELSSEEMSLAISALNSLDKDKDGELNTSEIGPAFPEFGRGRGRSGGGMGGPGGRGGLGGPGGFHDQSVKLVERFDADQDGMLNQQERAKAREFLKESRTAAGGMFGRGPGGPFGGRGPGGEAQASAVISGKRISPEDVTQYADADLYDPHVLRTLFFEFDSADWEDELADFHRTDVEVPAILVVDGKTYKNVGMRFRGMSSYNVPPGKKRSLNVTLDLADKEQSLLGYRTLNLLNLHADPSCLRTVLFDQVAQHYLPTCRANLVRVVINGESWGIYANEEQFNKDFTKRWFGSRGGVRWKVPANFSGTGALVFHGEDLAHYRGLYELKAKDENQAWRDLIALCKQLDQLPDDKLETELDRVMNVDRALWFLAIDNVFMDEDGYFSRGSDYSIYQDPKCQRFHVLPRDSNETFRYHGGGPGGPGGRRGFGGFGGPTTRDANRASLDPFSGIDSDMRPLIRRLLSNRNLRARYLAHMRTIVKEWLDWNILGPIFEDYRSLIVEDVMSDPHNLSTLADFFDADIAEPTGGGPFGVPPGIKRFVEDRRKFLLSHPELAKPCPVIRSVELPSGPQAGTPVQVVATVAEEVPVETVLLYYAVGREAPFQKTAMKRDATSSSKDTQYYSAVIPAVRAKDEVYYYVEARANAGVGTTTFSPARSEMGSLSYGGEATAAAGKDRKSRNKK